MKLTSLVGLGAGVLLLLTSSGLALSFSAGGGGGSSSGAGEGITPDEGTWPNGDALGNICHAVARAEGYQNGPGCAPWDMCNPGDLSPGDEGGYAVAGPPEFHGGSLVIHFKTHADGWAALRRKFQRMVSGESNVYAADWSWRQVAAQYAGNSQNWLTNVTGYLGVDPDSTPRDYANAGV